MKPFDLEKALAGHPLVTRDGRTVIRFSQDSTRPMGNHFTHFAMVAGFDSPAWFTETGRYTTGPDSPYDLFLADEAEQPNSDVPAGCKAFDLKQALAGAPLVTRDGRAVTDFKQHESGRMMGRVSGKMTFLGEEDFKDLYLIDRPEPAQETLFRTMLQEANDLIYGARHQDYGSVTKNFGDIAAGWSVIFGTTVTPKQVGLAMAWLKIAREVGNPKYDNLLDAAGYLGCVDKISKGE